MSAPRLRRWFGALRPRWAVVLLPPSFGEIAELIVPLPTQRCGELTLGKKRPRRPFVLGDHAPQIADRVFRFALVEAAG